MPPKGAKRHTANHHHARHEPGLAQPGKRVDRQGRQRQPLQQQQQQQQRPQSAHLNASSQRPDSSDGPQMPSRQEGSPGSSDAWLAIDPREDDGATMTRADADADAERVNEALRDAQSHGEDTWTRPIPKPDMPPRRIDVNAPGNPAVHLHRGPLQIAARLISSWPLADTLAILVVLLQIPPTVLSVIQFLYASLTLVPHVLPSTSMAGFGAFFGDVFDGAGHVPSVTMMLLADIVVFALWLSLWTPAQNLTLELAQAVIAASLGGRADDGDSGIGNTVICVGITMATHIGRHGAQPSRPSSLTAKAAASWDALPSAFGATPIPPRPVQGPVQVISALHILGQGLLGISGRWLAEPGRRDPSRSTKNVHRDPTSGEGEAIGPNGAATVVTVGRQGALIQRSRSTATSKEARPSHPTLKIRKGHGAPFRRLQPFWAAAANLKTFLAKEYDNTRVNAEAASAQARDLNNLGNAAFPSEQDRIWATGIDATELVFRTSAFHTTLPEKAPEQIRENGHLTSSSKPFYVRVDEAEWPSTRILHADNGADDPNGNGKWTAEVYGLAPGLNYSCEFRRTHDDDLVYCLNLTTPGTSYADTDVSSGSPSAVPKPLHPSSPTTTLLKSVASAETRLEEEKNALKKLRKEHKSHLASLKKEVDGFSTRFASSGNDDHRQRHRLQQIGQHIRQAEDATAAVCSRFEAMGDVPDDELAEWKESKERWEAAREQRSQVHDELNEQATQTERQKSTLQSEALSVQQKRERVQARQAKLTDQHERLNQSAVTGADEKERTTGPTNAEDDHRHSILDHYTSQIQHLHRTLQDLTLGGQHLWQQIRLIENAYREQQQQQQQQMMMTRAASSSGSQPPRTPESAYSGGAGGMHGGIGPNSSVARYGNFTMPATPTATTSAMVSSSSPHVPVSSTRSTSLYQEGRLRSSSMRSNRSGLAEHVEGSNMMALDPAAAVVVVNGKDHHHHPPPRDLARGDSRGSGGGGGRSRSGSHRDPSSPLARLHHPAYAASGGSSSSRKGGTPIWQ